MRAVFYKYASSSAEKPLVDKHDIQHALNVWSWFWVLVEAVTYFGTGAIIAWWLGPRALARAFSIIVVVLLITALLLRLRLPRYARPQIDCIAADPTATADIKKVFDAL
jgi:signal transduction histidine kinase